MAKQLPDRALMLVSDRRRLSVAATLPDVARRAAMAGVDLIQIREKDLAVCELTQLAVEVIDAVRELSVRVLINARADLAEAAGAWGVQLPEAGLPIAEVRRAFPRLAVGASRHSIDAALRAESEGADFIVLGPVFPSPGKEERVLGLELLQEAVSRLRAPIIAIGGIDVASAPSVWAAGVRGVAAIRPFLSQDPAGVVKSLRAI